jgi:hypothetical protein
MLTIITASVQAQIAIQTERNSAITALADPVIQRNRNSLAIVRTPGAQPATIHPTRSFAIMHAAT